MKRLPKHLLHAVTAAWQLRRQLLMDMWPLLLVPIAFVVFVVQNGGIVLGDKAAHAPVRHLVQPLYFCLFSATALAPFHFAPLRQARYFSSILCFFFSILLRSKASAVFCGL